MKIDMHRKELEEIKIHALDENTLLTALTDGPSHTKIGSRCWDSYGRQVFPRAAARHERVRGRATL